MKNTITEFCRETSLHGWKFIAKNKFLSLHCFFWVGTIFSALSLGLVLITWNTAEFMEATVDFTTLSMTTSMNEVFFPAIYIINKNFIRKSIEMSFYTNYNTCEYSYITYHIFGPLVILQIPPLPADRIRTMENVFDKFVSFNKQRYPMDEFPFLYHNHSVQMKTIDGLKLEFQEFLWKLSYGSLGGFIGTHTDLAGLLVHLDFRRGLGVTHLGGIFADNYLSPKNRFIPFYQTPGDIEELRSYKPKSISGRDSGIKFLIDAEVYDYTPKLLPTDPVLTDYYDSTGFTVGISHPFDFDLSEFHGIHVGPGTVVDIQVSAKLIVTPDEDYMRSRFEPDIRKCFFEDEVQLNHFPSWWFRYSMTNCLVEAQIQALEGICNCTPPHSPIILSKHDICKHGSANWDCLMKNYIEIGQVTSFKSKNQTQECHANCNDQPYEFTFTTTKFNLRNDGWKLCLVIKKILKSCKTFKQVTLNESYPGLCKDLALFDDEEMDCHTNFHVYKVS